MNMKNKPLFDGPQVSLMIKYMLEKGEPRCAIFETNPVCWARPPTLCETLKSLQLALHLWTSQARDEMEC